MKVRAKRVIQSLIAIAVVIVIVIVIVIVMTLILMNQIIPIPRLQVPNLRVLIHRTLRLKKVETNRLNPERRENGIRVIKEEAINGFVLRFSNNIINDLISKKSHKYKDQ
jgi:hypothetical protein